MLLLKGLLIKSTNFYFLTSHFIKWNYLVHFNPDLNNIFLFAPRENLAVNYKYIFKTSLISKKFENNLFKLLFNQHFLSTTFPLILFWKKKYIFTKLQRMEVEKVMEKEASPRTIKKVVMRMITAKVVTLAAKISSLSRRNENLNYLLKYYATWSF